MLTPQQLPNKQKFFKETTVQRCY